MNANGLLKSLYLKVLVDEEWRQLNLLLCFSLLDVAVV